MTGRWTREPLWVGLSLAASRAWFAAGSRTVHCFRGSRGGCRPVRGSLQDQLLWFTDNSSNRRGRQGHEVIILQPPEIQSICYRQTLFSFLGFLFNAHGCHLYLARCYCNSSLHQNLIRVDYHALKQRSGAQKLFGMITEDFWVLEPATICPLLTVGSHHRIKHCHSASAWLGNFLKI